MPALDWFNAASPLLSSALGGAKTPNQNISSASLNASSAFDNSGWVVSTGESTASQKQSPIVQWYVYAAAGFALILWYKHK